MAPPARPAFIISTASVPEEPGSYPGSDEVLSLGRRIGRAAGLQRIGLHVDRVPPGHRTSYPHAEKEEEEFVLVLDGNIDAWIDGELYPMTTGDLAAFPAGTGICHTFINNSDDDALLLVGGEASKATNQIFYPLNPARRGDLAASEWWDEVPARTLGPHDGLPARRR